MNKSFFAYLIFVKDHIEESNVLSRQRMKFLHEYNDCFADELPMRYHLHVQKIIALMWCQVARHQLNQLLGWVHRKERGSWSRWESFLKKVWCSQALPHIVHMSGNCILFTCPDLHKPLTVECDASGNRIGAVLHKEGHVVAFENRRLHDVELTLDTYERIIGCNSCSHHWKHYWGLDFMLKQIIRVHDISY